MGCGASGQFPSIPESQEFFERYSLGKKIGEGAFGQVRIVVERSSKRVFAVKVTDARYQGENGEMTGRLNKHRMKSTEREISTWRLACASGCAQICLLHEAFYSCGLYYLVCEMCQGDLMQHLLDVKFVTEARLADITSQMLKGVGHVHRLGMVHRDVKPENFLWGGPSGGTLKLCDFGLAQELKGKRLSGINGTAPYMAPEMLINSGMFAKRSCGKEADMWAVGVIVYLILFCRFPYMPEGEITSASMKNAIRKDHPKLEYPPSQAQLAVQLVQKLLVRDPAHRATAQQVLDEEPFFAKFCVGKAATTDQASISITAQDFASKMRGHKELGDKMRQYQFLPLQQKEIESLLRTLSTKSGGEWFSEGDETQNTAARESTVTKADSRIKKERSKGPISKEKFGTHSGVVSTDGMVEPDGLKSPTSIGSCNNEANKWRPVLPIEEGAPRIFADEIVERL
eukprot:TRINITY_DN107024_c0_g1_i1.p1 TRINITY_DN107024_c0_g1~~TRINITY_DN107024_c0_g1_i1.p1  ORF type:complete len:481 (-),score=79.47 TRINITY_DN107024_c0_g1_i1:41-1411(-)